MQIYDVTNPQGFFCQSKADVKCKQHLLLLKIIYSLLSYLFCFHTSLPVTTCHSRKAQEKRNVKALNSY